MMQFDFLCQQFSEYEIECFEEYIYIKKPGFTEPIRVYYEAGEYTVVFATQHIHLESDEEVIEAVKDFADARVAAIEFYDHGQRSFGGQIETSELEHLDYEKLRLRFWLGGALHQMTFRVYAWNKDYCFEGSFVKTAPKTVEIVKTEISC